MCSQTRFLKLCRLLKVSLLGVKLLLAQRALLSPILFLFYIMSKEMRKKTNKLLKKGQAVSVAA